MKRVIFLLDITKVGECACKWAANLVLVDIPEGIEIIGDGALEHCSSLTTVSFPTTLTPIGDRVFYSCKSLDNVDLRDTNLQELDFQVFALRFVRSGTTWLLNVLMRVLRAEL